VLNRAQWSALDPARVLFGLIILIFAAVPQETIVLAGDDTIERWRGKKIKQLGSYRDPVRSSKNHLVTGQSAVAPFGVLLGIFNFERNPQRLGVREHLIPHAPTRQRRSAMGLDCSEKPQSDCRPCF